eukprot:Opistho-2@6412
MKQLLYLPIVAVLFAVSLSSCKNDVPKEAKYIPKEAGFVLVLDPGQMKDKLQKGGISIDTLLNRIFKSDSLDVKDKARIEELKNNAGINWSNKMFVFGQQKSHADNSTSNTFSLIAGLEDAGKLAAYLQKQEELKGKSITKEKDYSYISTSDGSMLAWNDQQVIVTMYTHVLCVD